MGEESKKLPTTEKIALDVERARLDRRMERYKKKAALIAAFMKMDPSEREQAVLHWIRRKRWLASVDKAKANKANRADAARRAAIVAAGRAWIALKHEQRWPGSVSLDRRGLDR